MSSTTNLYYVGGLYDVDTKLIKFGVRSYDPEVGRWMQKEPDQTESILGLCDCQRQLVLGFAGALNFYSYANGDSVNLVDTTGLLSEKCDLLLKLVNYEIKANQSRWNFKYIGTEYHTANHGALDELNTSYMSIDGPVNIDWMFRTSLYGLGSVPILNDYIYFGEMFFWQAMLKPFGNWAFNYNRSHNVLRVYDLSKINAPHVYLQWFWSDKYLAEIFRPAMKECFGYCSLRPNARECKNRKTWEKLKEMERGGYGK